MPSLLDLADKMPQRQAHLASKLPAVVQRFQSLKQAVERVNISRSNKRL